MLRRIAGANATPQEIAALRTLADVVEPVKDYTRETTAPAEPTSATPLNRLVDAIPLESDPARRFTELVDKFLSTNCRDTNAADQLRAQLATWRDNDARLQTVIERSYLAKELAATSRDLSSAAAAGLAALDFASKGTAAPDDWKAQQSAILAEANRPKAQLLLMPAAAIQKLVDAAATGGSCTQPK
jgi:hexosaminidase